MSRRKGHWPFTPLGKLSPKFRPVIFPPRYGSALPLGRSHQHGPQRGGCHERSPERSTTVLLLDRVGYRCCHRGRDTAHLSRSASRGLRSLMLSGPFTVTLCGATWRFLSAPKWPGFALGHRRLQQHAGHIHAAGAFVGYQSRFAQSWLDAHHIVHGGSTPRA